MMQIKVNSNYLWSNIIIDQLVECGVKYACVSPGSRSTPITYAISQNKKIQSYVIIDERTSGFFALGLAKQSRSPVLIVTTSGTATVELYPSIIEAYQNRVPIIIFTADRPAYLRNSGANQTINQDNIYGNHIRFFYDTGLPKLDIKNIIKLKSKVINAFDISTKTNVGPVHINLPFEKPLEPDSFTDEIKENILLESLPNEIGKNKIYNKTHDENKNLLKIFEFMKKNKKGLITIGAGNFSETFVSLLENFSIKFALPIFADASSGLRFKSKSISNLISNYDALLRCDAFTKSFSAKFVLHFGRPLTSPKVDEFLANLKSNIFNINRFGDFNKKSKKTFSITLDEENFLDFFINNDINIEFSDSLKKIKYLDVEIEKIKSKAFSILKKLNEPGVLLNIVNSIPPNSNLMVGNSVPIRDFDFFSTALNKNINVFQNRGASGIDGITSTSLGICVRSKHPTYLVIGDLSFYYDINSLLIAKQYNIPLIIVLINNNGGAIFNFLPIANHKNVFKKYFSTPTNLSFKKLTEAFEIDYKELKSQREILNHIKISSVRKNPVVYEIKTNASYSLSLRKNYWKKVDKFVANNLRNYEA